jgi:hypothetical protein
MSHVHPLSLTTIELTSCVRPVLLMTLTAPASNGQALGLFVGVQPEKRTLDEGPNGVGKLAGFARKVSAYPTETSTPTGAADAAVVVTAVTNPPARMLIPSTEASFFLRPPGLAAVEVRVCE